MAQRLKKCALFASVLVVALYFALPAFSFTLDRFCEDCSAIELNCLCPADRASGHFAMAAVPCVTYFAQMPPRLALGASLQRYSPVCLKIRMNC